MRIKMGGFTLSELMLALLLLGLLLVVATWQYGAYRLRLDDQAVVAMLQKNAAYLEQYYSEHSTYKASPTTWPLLPYDRYPDSGAIRYSVAFGSTPRNTDADYYILRATASDPDLGYIELLQTGILRQCKLQGSRVQCQAL